MVLCFGLALFLSAYLLFLVQPMIARMVLPLLGGTPAVWNTCMLFFQIALLAGYAYAHLIPSRLGLRRQVWLHVLLLALPLVVLPIRLPGWNPPVTGNPIPWLLALLGVTVGLPFLLLSTSAPLFQHWFAASGHRSARDPYFLYAASNFGSMLALISYPVFWEPYLRLSQQASLWLAGYLLLYGLVILCAIVTWRQTTKSADAGLSKLAEADDPGMAAPAPTGWRRLRWVVLALIPSSLMLGVTTYITTDIAPVPLLWVIPLALYLLSFILVFSRLGRRLHPAMVCLLPVMILLLLLPSMNVHLPVAPEIIAHLAAFFIAAMVCHGELAQMRPAAGYLTEYYLWISIGGMLGGLFNALLAPEIFNRIIEYPLAIVLICFLRPSLYPARRLSVARKSKRDLHLPATFAEKASLYATLLWPIFGVWAGILFYFLSFRGDWDRLLLAERNFFGTASVRLNKTDRWLQFEHGTTIHGMQYLDPHLRNTPMGYYIREGPIGQVFTAWKGDRSRRDVAVIGLGIGGLAAYAEPKQRWTFYEIDPAVERIAWDTRYFTYLQDAQDHGTRVKVALGDARLQLAQTDDRYDLMVMDAFSSDSIPVHLVTREALRLYLQRLKEHGLLVFHVSNQFLNLAPVVADLARDAGLICYYREEMNLSPEDLANGKLPSQWTALVRRPEDFERLARTGEWTQLPGRSSDRVWTDDFSNILGVIAPRITSQRLSREYRESTGQ